jgi:hypothetical protein
VPTTPALAQTIILYGAGSINGGCGEWARTAVTEGGDAEWLLGYLSAVNAYLPGADGNVTEGRANVSVLDWMKLWCRNHPLDQTAMAANALLAELVSRRAGQPPSTQPAPRVSKIPGTPDQLLPPR